MPTLPTPGGDVGTWGTELNEFLTVAHLSGGGLKAIPYNVLDYGAVALGTTNNQAAFQAANDAAAAAGGGLVYAPEGTWGLNGLFTVGDKVAFRGAGKLATTIRCLSAGSRVQFGTFGAGDRRGLSGMFEVDGNNLATNPLLIASGANSDYIDIKVGSAAAGGDGFLISAVQNIGVYSCEVQSCTNGLVFDRGTKNITITRGTINECSVGVLLRMTAAHPTNANNKQPERIVISDVLNETNVVGGVGVQVNACRELFIVRGGVNAPGIVFKTELLDPAGLGAAVDSLVINGAQLSAISAGTVFHLTSGSNLLVMGGTHTQGVVTQFDVRHINARVFLDSSIRLDPSTTRFSTTVARTEGQIVSLNGAYDLGATNTYSSTNNTAYQQPTDLTMYKTPAQSTWDVESVLLVDGLAAAQLQLHWNLPASATIEWTSLGLNTSDVLTYTRNDTAGAPTFGLAGAGTTRTVTVKGRLVLAGTTGNVFPEFRQVTTNGTATRVLPGSWVRFTRVRSEQL